VSVFAVIDTNVLVSALLSKQSDAATVRTMRLVLNGRITPLYNKAILEEYREVLCRETFHLSKDTVRTVVGAIVQFGIEVCPKQTGEKLPDPDDLVFYEVALGLTSCNAYLVTGNKKHFPDKDFIVSPATMIGLMGQE
jgi:predicted nucleic acid-binding protein